MLMASCVAALTAAAPSVGPRVLGMSGGDNGTAAPFSRDHGRRRSTAVSTTSQFLLVPVYGGGGGGSHLAVPSAPQNGPSPPVVRRASAESTGSSFGISGDDACGRTTPLLNNKSSTVCTAIYESVSASASGDCCSSSFATNSNSPANLAGASGKRISFKADFSGADDQCPPLPMIILPRRNFVASLIRQIKAINF